MKSTVSGCLLCILLSSSAQAVGDSHVQDNFGELYVHGQLLESTCGSVMESPWQEVNPGLAFTPPRSVELILILQDCPEETVRLSDLQLANALRGKLHPAYSARFIGDPNQDNPELVMVQGADDVGLRLRDRRGKTARLSKQGAVIPLVVGQQTIRYTVTAERVRADYSPKTYHALITLSMDYL